MNSPYAFAVRWRRVASWLVRSSLERAVWVRALARDFVLCSLAGHLILIAPLLHSNINGDRLIKCRGYPDASPCDGLTSHKGGVEMLFFATEPGISSSLMGVPKNKTYSSNNPKRMDSLLPPFSLIRDFGKQNTRGNVSKISVSLTCYRHIGSKSTNHSPLA